MALGIASTCSVGVRPFAKHGNSLRVMARGSLQPCSMRTSPTWRQSSCTRHPLSSFRYGDTCGLSTARRPGDWSDSCAVTYRPSGGTTRTPGAQTLHPTRKTAPAHTPSRLTTRAQACWRGGRGLVAAGPFRELAAAAPVASSRRLDSSRRISASFNSTARSSTGSGQSRPGGAHSAKIGCRRGGKGTSTAAGNAT